MLTRRQIEEISRFNRLPLHILEQDYIQAVFLSRLSVQQGVFDLLFKGGTCIRFVYGLDRYSEDLDFTMMVHDSESPPEIRDTLQHCVSDLDSLGIESRLDKVKEFAQGFSARLRYNGPLYDGTERSAGSIWLDVSKRDDHCSEPFWAVIRPRYADIAPFRLACMAEEEILAEKVRALVQRAKARDFYDVWFLLKKGISLDKGLLMAKCEALGFEFRLPAKGFTLPKKEWEQDMSNLLPTPMNHTQVMTELNAALKKALR